MTYMMRSTRVPAGRARALALGFTCVFLCFGCGGDDDATGDAGSAAGSPAPSGAGGGACMIREDQLRLMPGSECELNGADLAKYRIQNADTVSCDGAGQVTIGKWRAVRTIRLNGLEVSCGDD